MTQNGAIIGCGSVHGVHAEALRKLPGKALAAVCDSDPEALKAAESKYGCRGYADWRELVRDPGVAVVHICAPHHLHAEMAIGAMEAGKDVLCEKPAAIRPADALRMAETAERLGRHLAVCFQNRFNDTSRMMRDAIRSGRTGAPLGAKAVVTWKRGAAYYTGSPWRGRWATEGGGVLINQAIHTLDLLQWLLGPVESLKGHVDRYTLADAIEVEDTADLFLRFASGARAIFYATNSYVANSPVELEVVCENATLRLADGLTIAYRDGAVESCVDSVDRTDEKSYWGSSHARLIDAFYRSIAEGRPFEIDGREGIPTLRIIEAAYESARTGSSVGF
jgi:predicted dehydrogenase